MASAPSTRDGLYTHAIYGFLTTLQRLLDEEQPEALCVTFDRREPTFRHQADERYKAQRKGCRRSWPCSCRI